MIERAGRLRLLALHVCDWRGPPRPPPPGPGRVGGGERRA